MQPRNHGNHFGLAPALQLAVLIQNLPSHTVLRCTKQCDARYNYPNYAVRAMLGSNSLFESIPVLWSLHS